VGIGGSFQFICYNHRVASLLQLRGVSKSYGGVAVLREVDFDVRAAEVHAVVGENGAGKSTLMNVVSGVVAPDAGEMLWNGAVVRLRGPRDARRLGIAFVHQDLALVPQLSAAENIFLGRHPVGAAAWVRWDEIAERAGALLSELGRPMDPRTLVGELAMAERQLVEIARALASDARLLIMDEPTAALGERDVERLFGVIERLRGRGVAVIFISHRLPEVFAVAGRVTVLRDGQRVLEADTASLDHEALVRAMVGDELGAFDAPARGTDAVAGPEALRVSRPVEIAVRRGEVVGLAGLAGAGRTELLEAIFGARTERAEVSIDGRAVRLRSPRDAVRHGIALVPDDRKGKGLVPGASLEFNIALAGGRGRRLLRPAADRAAAERLSRELRIRCAGIAQPVERLSGGNQQKVVLAKWLYAGARIFLLDEPTRGIDVRSKAEIYDVIRSLAAAGAALLLASSETAELLRVADRIVVMHRGRIAGELSRAAATESRIMQLATGGV
jgi:ABC-type sugar transport system ATPase subunit